MKTPVSDEAVNEYAERLRAGLAPGQVFPARMIDCDFTPPQREIIRQARAERKALQRNGTVGRTATGSRKTVGAISLAAVPAPAAQPRRVFSKLGKLLYLQSGRCFFCGEPLKEEEASIEHLNPKSRGGSSTDDNEVACHRSLNETFGSLDLKSKFAFVLRSAGSFKCPG